MSYSSIPLPPQQIHYSKKHTTLEYKRLLLVFRPTSSGDYILINRPGLPLSPYCTALTRDPVVDMPASLLSAVTAVIDENEEGMFEGFTFLLTRPANDGYHVIVILEKAVPVDCGDLVKTTSVSNDDAYADTNTDFNSNADGTRTKENTTKSNSPKTLAVLSEWDWDVQHGEQTWSSSTNTRRAEASKPSGTGGQTWARAPKEARTKRDRDLSPVRPTSRNATTGDWESSAGNVREWAWTPSSIESADAAV